MLEDILKIHRAGQLDEAEQRYREWLAFNPDDPEALHLLAILRRQQGDLREALELAIKANDIAPDRANYQLTLAGLWLHVRDYARARDGFATALRLEPNALGAALGVGQVALLQGDVSGAQEAISRAERLAPEHPQVLAQKGTLAQTRGEHQKAVAFFLEAAKRNPNDPAFQANVARSFAALGQAAFAEQALRNAVRLKPDYHVARVALAQQLLLQRRVDESLAEFEHVLAMQPAHPLALAGRADIRRGRNDVAGALDDYRKAHEAAPEIASITVNFVRSLAVTGAGDEGRRILAKAIERAPADADLRRLETTFAARQDDDGFIESCRAWLAADPANREARARLASALELRGEFAEADAIARDALVHDSRANFARLILARSALREGRPEDAQEQLNRVPEAALTPARKVERAQLRGLARDGLGDHAGAVDAWRTAHRVQTGLAPLVMPPEPTMDWPRVAAGNEAPAPAFMIGLPGAGTESLAILLRMAGARVLGDRFGQRMRGDAIATGEFTAMAAKLADDPAQAATFRERYLAGLAAVDEIAGGSLVDWLPFFDLRLAAMIEAAFPNARYICLQRDLRDCLLTWLALGTPQALAFGDPVDAGAWLARRAAHQETFRQRVDGSRLLSIDSGELDQPEALLMRVREFLALPAPATTPDPQHLRGGRGGLSTTLPDGRWRAYADVLGSAFAQLQ
jgi:tetratricopeptide (TPR) repeat protein